MAVVQCELSIYRRSVVQCIRRMQLEGERRVHESGIGIGFSVVHALSVYPSALCARRSRQTREECLPMGEAQTFFCQFAHLAHLKLQKLRLIVARRTTSAFFETAIKKEGVVQSEAFCHSLEAVMLKEAAS